MKYFFVFLLAMTFMAPAFAKADMLVEGMHRTTTCISIDNADAYSKYSIYAVGGARFATTQGPLGSEPICSDMFRYLFAVRAEDDASLNKVTVEAPEEPVNWAELPENEQYILAPQADLSRILGPLEVLDVDPTYKREYVLHLTDFCEACTKPSFTVVNMTTYDADGHVISSVPREGPEAEVTPVQLTGTSSTATPFPTTLVVVLLVCLGGAGIAVATKSWKN